MKYAAQLRVSGSNIIKVGYEHDLIRSFDDITVHYQKPIIDTSYGEVNVDFFQVKFRMRPEHPITWDALMNPDFIGATSISLLERLRNGVVELREQDLIGRFTLFAPQPIGDDLRHLITNTSSAFDLNKLFDGRPRTEQAKVRRKLLDHLGITSEDDLRKILAPLRIQQAPDLDELREQASTYFVQAGMHPWNGTERANRYDDLPRKIAQSGLKVFDREQFEAILQAEELIVAAPQRIGAPPRRLGIKSYAKHTERMREETDALCCLLEFFDERQIRETALWDTKIRPIVEQFLRDSPMDATAVDLTLAVHPTIAFTAGWYADPKSPIDFAPMQFGSAWRPDRSSTRPAHLWQATIHEAHNDGLDCAVCVSATHNTFADASDYISRMCPSVGKIIHLEIEGGHGNGSIRDGTHAYHLAAAAADEIIPHVGRGSNRGSVHLFASAPNALIFLLGQLSHRLGCVVLYEYDFKREDDYPYTRTLTLS